MNSNLSFNQPKKEKQEIILEKEFKSILLYKKIDLIDKQSLELTLETFNKSIGN